MSVQKVVPGCCEPFLKWKWNGKEMQGTPRSAVDRYFYQNHRRAIRLAMALCRRTGAPRGWSWERWVQDGFAQELAYWERVYASRKWFPRPRPTPDFRKPPVPRGGLHGPGHCWLCGRPIYDLGWHKPWRGDELNTRASWHAACGYVYRLMAGPSAPDGMHADHIVPLYRAFREHGRTGKWPDIYRFWLPGNIQYLTPEEHSRKCAEESRERADFRRSDGSQEAAE